MVMAAIMPCSLVLAPVVSCCTLSLLTFSLRRPLLSMSSVPALLFVSTTTRTSVPSRLLLVLSVLLSLRRLSVLPSSSALSPTLFRLCFPLAFSRLRHLALGASHCLSLLVLLSVPVLVIFLSVLVVLVLRLCLLNVSSWYCVEVMAMVMMVLATPLKSRLLLLSRTTRGALCGRLCLASTLVLASPVVLVVVEVLLVLLVVVVLFMVLVLLVLLVVLLMVLLLHRLLSASRTSLCGFPGVPLSLTGVPAKTRLLLSSTLFVVPSTDFLSSVLNSCLLSIYMC